MKRLKTLNDVFTLAIVLHKPKCQTMRQNNFKVIDIRETKMGNRSYFGVKLYSGVNDCIGYVHTI